LSKEIETKTSDSTDDFIHSFPFLLYMFLAVIGEETRLLDWRGAPSVAARRIQAVHPLGMMPVHAGPLGMVDPGDAFIGHDVGMH
jgi:hypothetical protein